MNKLRFLRFLRYRKMVYTYTNLETGKREQQVFYVDRFTKLPTGGKRP